MTPPSRRTTIWLAVLALAAVLVPFQVWHETWFGRQLTDDDLTEYLAEREKPRRIQHALSQISDRLSRGESIPDDWRTRLVDLADHDEPKIRTTTAWVLGQDNTSETFHQTLLRMLQDEDLMVRRNAALSLVRFQDASGRPELVQMLRPHPFRAPKSGIIVTLAEQGQEMWSGALLARIALVAGGQIEVRTPFAGRIYRTSVSEGADVAGGDLLVSVAPDAGQVWEALRALYLVGELEDLPDVERYEQGVADMPARIQRQAAMTAKAIRTRSEQSSIR